MKVHLQTLGCRLNEAESRQWADQFAARGHQITADADSADLLVINTCAVTAEAGRKSRQLIRRARRHNPAARIVASGCYATLAREQLGVDLEVGNQDKDHLARRVEAALPEWDIAAAQTAAQTPPRPHRPGRSRAFIKAQDGCRWRCAYCVITTARGAERSVAPRDIVRRVNEEVARGAKEVVLTGVHLGGYGADCGSSLPALIKAVLSETDAPRIRLGSLEPWDLSEDFFALFADTRLLPHLHLPLQSGSDAVLRLMSRRCRVADFAALARAARAAAAGFNLSTDIIVGFPGETEQHWREGLEFIERMGFGRLHIFPFSARPGTKAAAMPGRVPAEVIKLRCEELRRLSRRMQADFMRRQHGRVCPVLLEAGNAEHAGRFVYKGYTPNYARVQYESGRADLGNRIAHGKTVLRRGRLVLEDVALS